MHIPDGYLSPSTCAAFTGLMLPVWYRAAAVLRRQFDIERVPRVAMGAVFAFLIMMFNVPIPNGTTVHATGAVLLAIVLGPWAAVLAMSVALLIQALIFGDGGILTFGANALNIAYVMSFSGYYTYRLLAKGAMDGSRRQIAAVAVAAYIGLNMAALATAVEFGIQPLFFKVADGTPLYCPYGLEIAIPAVMAAHLTIGGVVEAIVTAIAVRFMLKRGDISLQQDTLRGV